MTSTAFQLPWYADSRERCTRCCLQIQSLSDWDASNIAVVTQYGLAAQSRWRLGIVRSARNCSAIISRVTHDVRTLTSCGEFKRARPLAAICIWHIINCSCKPEQGFTWLAESMVFCHSVAVIEEAKLECWYSAVTSAMPKSPEKKSRFSCSQARSAGTLRAPLRSLQIAEYDDWWAWLAALLDTLHLNFDSLLWKPDAMQLKWALKEI